MHKPEAVPKMSTEYGKHLRSGNGDKREYWRGQRAKAKEDLREKVREETENGEKEEQ